jgi:hypothetical protein
MTEMIPNGKLFTVIVSAFPTGTLPLVVLPLVPPVVVMSQITPVADQACPFCAQIASLHWRADPLTPLLILASAGLILWNLSRSLLCQRRRAVP